MAQHIGNWMEVMQAKHENHIRAHEASYGAKLGELKNPPTQEQLDADFEERKREGSLFKLDETDPQKA